jgi:hypothetical protein
MTELDETEPEVTKLWGGVASVGRAIRSNFPTLRRPGIKWRFFGHQGFPWCPICGAMIAGAAPYHQNRRKLSPGQQAHEQWHDWLDQLAATLEQAAEVLGIETERDENGTIEDDPAPRDSHRG